MDQFATQAAAGFRLHWHNKGRWRERISKAPPTEESVIDIQVVIKVRV
jgi:hypothetical protein